MTHPGTDSPSVKQSPSHLIDPEAGALTGYKAQGLTRWEM